jgi:hypothetical protein
MLASSGSRIRPEGTETKMTRKPKTSIIVIGRTKEEVASWQWPGVETIPAPPSTFESWSDYLERTTVAERMKACRGKAKRANRKRLLSSAPEVTISAEDVWKICEAARGRCAYCGSLAVESCPLKPNGKLARWAQIGRRIASLGHLQARMVGGDNDLSNLLWSCNWCNTHESERRRGATDHGGFYPDEPLKQSGMTTTPITPVIESNLHLQGFRLDGYDDDAQLFAAVKREGIAEPIRALRIYFDSHRVLDDDQYVRTFRKPPPERPQSVSDVLLRARAKLKNQRT